MNIEPLKLGRVPPIIVNSIAPSEPNLLYNVAPVNAMHEQQLDDLIAQCITACKATCVAHNKYSHFVPADIINLQVEIRRLINSNKSADESAQKRRLAIQDLDNATYEIKKIYLEMINVEREMELRMKMGVSPRNAPEETENAHGGQETPHGRLENLIDIQEIPSTSRGTHARRVESKKNSSMIQEQPWERKQKRKKKSKHERIPVDEPRANVLEHRETPQETEQDSLGRPRDLLESFQAMQINTQTTTEITLETLENEQISKKKKPRRKKKSKKDIPQTDNPLQALYEPSIELETPETFDAPSSSFDAPSSSFDAPSASFDAPSASFDAPSASFDAPSARFDAPSARFDAPSARFDAPSVRLKKPSRRAISTRADLTLEEEIAQDLMVAQQNPEEISDWPELAITERLRVKENALKRIKEIRETRLAFVRLHNRRADKLEDNKDRVESELDHLKDEQGVHFYKGPVMDWLDTLDDMHRARVDDEY